MPASAIVSAIVGRQLTEEENSFIDLTPKISDLDNLTPRATPLDRQTDRQIERVKQQHRKPFESSDERDRSDMDSLSIQKEMDRLKMRKTAAEAAATGLKALEKEAKRVASSRGLKSFSLSSRVILGAAQGVMRGVAESNQVELNQLAERKREAERQEHTHRTGGTKTKKTLKKYKGSILVHKGKLDKFNKCSSRSCHKNKIRRTKRRRGTKRRRR